MIVVELAHGLRVDILFEVDNYYLRAYAEVKALKMTRVSGRCQVYEGFLS